jgi:hypothetical protein
VPGGVAGAAVGVEQCGVLPGVDVDHAKNLLVVSDRSIQPIRPLVPSERGTSLKGIG